MNQAITFTNARIKLYQRHVREWHRLINHQQTVWKLLDEETAGKLLAHQDDKAACVELRNTKMLRLTKILAAQRQERARMKARHQNDLSLLEQSF